jgi:hypothetical protein
MRKFFFGVRFKSGCWELGVGHWLCSKELLILEDRLNKSKSIHEFFSLKVTASKRVYRTISLSLREPQTVQLTNLPSPAARQFGEGNEG